MPYFILLALVFLCPALSLCADSVPKVSPQDAELFETRVRPVLVKNCYGCHGVDQQLSSLRLDSREAVLKGGKRGPSVVTGQPDSSLLIQAIRHEGLRMPMGNKLKPQEIAALEEWVRKGAPWPATPTGASAWTARLAPPATTPSRRPRSSSIARRRRRPSGSS